MPELASAPVLVIPAAASPASSTGRPSASGAVGVEPDFAAAFAEAADAAGSGRPKAVPPGVATKKAPGRADAVLPPAKESAEAEDDSDSGCTPAGGWLPVVPAETLVAVRSGAPAAEVVDEGAPSGPAQAARPSATAIPTDTVSADDAGPPATPHALRAGSAPASPADGATQAPASAAPLPSGTISGWAHFGSTETLGKLRSGATAAEVADEKAPDAPAQAARPTATAIRFHAEDAADAGAPAAGDSPRAGLAATSHANVAADAPASAAPLRSGTSKEELGRGTGLPAAPHLGWKPEAASRESAPAAGAPAAAKPGVGGSSARGGGGTTGIGAASDASAAAAAATTEPPSAAANRLIEDLGHRIDRAMAANAPAATRGDPGLQPLNAATSALAAFGLPASSAQPPSQVAVATPVGSPGFVEEFSQQVTMLTRGGVHRAELSLQPADLGPVGISIEVRGNDATLLFTAQHAATRAALDEALPRLREMLSAQGLQLADARVGTQAGGGSARDGDRRQHGFAAAVDRRQGRPDHALPVAPVAVRPRQARLIDDIA